MGACRAGGVALSDSSIGIGEILGREVTIPSIDVELQPPHSKESGAGSTFGARLPHY